MIEVQCPITGEVSEWPNRLACQVGIAQALSREHGISLGDIWTMAKVTREMGRRWFADSCEFQELLVRINCDKERLDSGGLDVIELEEIYYTAHRMLSLLRKHARNPKQRKKIEDYLREIEAMHQINFEATLPVLHPDVLAMLERKVS
jgi:hypothetical protein